MKQTVLTLILALSLAVSADEAPSKAKQVIVSQEQCWSVTKSGNRCSRRARPCERYCKQHSPEAPIKNPPKQCMSMTEKGLQCAKKPADGKRYCARHAK